MEERARNKRKLRDLEQEEAGEDDDDDDDDDGDSFEAIGGVEVEKPGQGLRKPKTAEPNNKKLKRDDDQGDKAADDSENEVDDNEPAKDTVPAAEEPQTKTKLSKKEEKKAAKSQKRKEKKAELKARKADKQSTAPSEHNGTAPPAEDAPTPAKKDKKKQKKETNPAGNDAEKPEDRPANHDDIDDDDVTPGKGHEINFSGNIQQQDDEEESGPSSSTPQSPTFDTSAPNGAAGDGASASTSVSSTVPPSEKPKHIKIPTDTSNLRARLAARIEALRAARKADGPDGKPIRTRQELIESRRAKQAQRKAHKKELRQKAKLEEEREEALASNSPSVMSPAVEHPSRADSPGDGGFAFGRVAFGDGTRLSHDLSYVLSSGKRKGPSDPKTALLKVQNQKKRLQELDEEKRRDVAEKDTWLNARRRAEGEKIRDDEGILKKTVKRKEASKRKSEKAWKDRIKGVEHAQKEKQKKREENIKKRREEKLMGKAGKKKGGGGGGKKKPRPGFEGSLGVGGRRK